MKYRTTRDIIIPAGTIVGEAPMTTGYGTPHGEILLGFDKDSTGSLRFDIEEAERAGVIEKIEEARGDV